MFGKLNFIMLYKLCLGRGGLAPYQEQPENSLTMPGDKVRVELGQIYICIALDNRYIEDSK